MVYADCSSLADGFQLSAFADGRKKLSTAEIAEKGRRENAEQVLPKRIGAWPHSRGGCGYVSSAGRPRRLSQREPRLHQDFFRGWHGQDSMHLADSFVDFAVLAG
jgi:hypothetical protein